MESMYCYDVSKGETREVDWVYFDLSKEFLDITLRSSLKKEPSIPIDPERASIFRANPLPFFDLLSAILASIWAD